MGQPLAERWMRIWCGRPVGPAGRFGPGPGVERVDDLDEWTQVARACGVRPSSAARMFSHAAVAMDSIM